MKNPKIFLYLLLISLLYILFQHQNAAKKIAADQQKITRQFTTIKKLKATKDSLQYQLEEATDFSLLQDTYAKEYLEDQNLDALDITSLITDTFITNNHLEKDNPLVPMAGMMGATKVDRVKVLNHKWIIADYTDGTYWGQALYNYDFNADKTLNLEVIASHIYPKH